MPKHPLLFPHLALTKAITTSLQAWATKERHGGLRFLNVSIVQLCQRNRRSGVLFSGRERFAKSDISRHGGYRMSLYEPKPVLPVSGEYHWSMEMLR